MNRPTRTGYPDPGLPEALRFAGNALRALEPAFASLGLPATRLDIKATLREAQLADESRQHIFGNG